MNALFGMIHLLLLPIWLFGMCISLLLFVFWLWMLVSAITSRALGDGEKIGWVLAMLFLPGIGTLLYFFIGRPRAGA